MPLRQQEIFATTRRFWRALAPVRSHGLSKRFATRRASKPNAVADGPPQTGGHSRAWRRRLFFRAGRRRTRNGAASMPTAPRFQDGPYHRRQGPSRLFPSTCDTCSALPPHLLGQRLGTFPEARRLLAKQPSQNGGVGCDRQREAVRLRCGRANRRKRDGQAAATGRAAVSGHDAVMEHVAPNQVGKIVPIPKAGPPARPWTMFGVKTAKPLPAKLR